MPNATDTLNTLLAQYGLSSLGGALAGFMQQGITDQATLMLLLRETPAYQNRFPAMKALSAKNRSISEADYINYEKNAAQTEQQYGMPKGFLTDPHRIQGMLEADVSASELNARAQINAAATINAPQETKEALKSLYGLDQGALTAFYFDPDNAEPYLQKVTASAQIAGDAARQRLSIGRDTAESLVAQGVSDAQAQAGFQTVAAQAGLGTGAGEVASEAARIGAAFGNADDAAQVDRVRAGRLAQFGGGGGAQGAQTGISGLGVSGR